MIATPAIPAAEVPGKDYIDFVQYILTKGSSSKADLFCVENSETISIGRLGTRELSRTNLGRIEIWTCFFFNFCGISYFFYGKRFFLNKDTQNISDGNQRRYSEIFNRFFEQIFFFVLMIFFFKMLFQCGMGAKLERLEILLNLLSGGFGENSRFATQ